jgi:hypothetical protein
MQNPFLSSALLFKARRELKINHLSPRELAIKPERQQIASIAWQSDTVMSSYSCGRRQSETDRLPMTVYCSFNYDAPKTAS